MSDGTGETLLDRARDAPQWATGTRPTTCWWRRTRVGLLGAADLPLLAEVAYAAGHLDVTIEVWERAHAEGVRAGDVLAAAGAAVRVAMHLLFDTALMAPVRGLAHACRASARGSGRDARPRLGGGGSQLRADADR